MFFIEVVEVWARLSLGHIKPWYYGGIKTGVRQMRYRTVSSFGLAQVSFWLVREWDSLVECVCESWIWFTVRWSTMGFGVSSVCRITILS